MRSPRGGGGAAGQEHVDLIPSIPDDVVVDCLARVPHASHRAMRRICRGWRSTAATPAFASTRAAVGANEDLVYLMQFGNPSASGDEPKDEDGPAGEWRRERGAPPVVPVFSQCAAVGMRLAVLGGWDPRTFEPVANVHVLDAATGRWCRGVPLHSARSFFACAEEGGKIYVAGGHDQG